MNDSELLDFATKYRFGTWCDAAESRRLGRAAWASLAGRAFDSPRAALTAAALRVRANATPPDGATP